MYGAMISSATWYWWNLLFQLLIARAKMILVLSTEIGPVSVSAIWNQPRLEDPHMAYSLILFVGHREVMNTKKRVEGKEMLKREGKVKHQLEHQ